MATRIKTRILHKIDFVENWEKNNPILRYGEIGFAADGQYKNWFKLGDGVTPWNELSFAYSEFLATLVNVDNVTLEMDENKIIRIKETGVTAGVYEPKYEGDNLSIPAITVNSTGQITSIENRNIEIKQTVSVIPVTGNYVVSANQALIAGKSTEETACIITIPKMPIGTQVTIKNVTSDKHNITVRPDTDISIDNYKNIDILLAPYDFITIVAISSTEWSIVSESSRFDKEQLKNITLNDNVVIRNDSLLNSEEIAHRLTLNSSLAQLI